MVANYICTFMPRAVQLRYTNIISHALSVWQRTGCRCGSGGVMHKHVVARIHQQRAVCEQDEAALADVKSRSSGTLQHASLFCMDFRTCMQQHELPLGSSCRQNVHFVELC
jgi:hypothetical protein